MSVLGRVAGRAAGLPPALDRRVTVERNLAVPVADGVTLLADRWVPGDTGPGDGPPPLVLLRSPYGRRRFGLLGRLFAERGYQTVIQSCRGTFGSGGRWEPFRHERADGHATLAWLADQPWGRTDVFLYGPSYLGLTLWAACDDPPPWVRAIAPSITATCVRDAVVQPGGAFALDTALTWASELHTGRLPAPLGLAAGALARPRTRRAMAVLPLSEADRAAVGRQVPWIQAWLDHELPDDPWWAPADFSDGRPTAPPATLLAGWYDIFLAEQVADFVAMRAAGRPARLTVGPWTHASPGAFTTGLREALAWFGAHGGPAGGPPPASEVRVFVMGDDRWLDLPSWPPPAEPRRWHLHPAGRLDPAPPPPSAADRYQYDPADPTPAVGGATLHGGSAGPRDQQRRERRDDVLVYTSAPLPDDLTVIGPVTADLHLHSSLADTDVFVRLCAVARGGRSTNVCDGFLRLRADTSPAAADGVMALRVTLGPTAVTFARGTSIRLQVSGGAHPLIARNTGSGDPLSSASRCRVAQHELLHDPEHPSALTLPAFTG